MAGTLKLNRPSWKACQFGTCNLDKRRKASGRHHGCGANDWKVGFFEIGREVDGTRALCTSDYIRVPRRTRC